MAYFKVASITDTKFHLPFFERNRLILKTLGWCIAQKAKKKPSEGFDPPWRLRIGYF